MLLESLRQSEDDCVEALAAFSGHRVDLIEVCCGPNSLLSQTVVEHGGTAERVGLFNGFDLSSNKGFEKAKKFIAAKRPRWLWFSLPCGPTSSIQNLNELTPEGLAKSLKRKRKSRQTVKNCVALAKEHVDGGNDIGWEWPRNNQAWHFPEMKRFLGYLEMVDRCFDAKLDGCMVGVVAPDNGIPMRKPWQIVSTSSEMAVRLSITCDGQHEHTQCLGHDRAAFSAFYPRKMCRLITKVVLSTTGSCFGVLDAKGNEEPTKDEIESISPEALKQMKDAIHKLHTRSGHPSNQSLVSCLRARGVPRIVLALAKEHKCDSCQEVRLPTPHQKVTLSKAEVLWHTLQIDMGQVRVGDEVIHVMCCLCWMGPPTISTFVRCSATTTPNPEIAQLRN